MAIYTKTEIRAFKERHNAVVDSHYLDHMQKRFDALEPRTDIIGKTELRMLKSFLALRLGEPVA